MWLREETLRKRGGRAMPMNACRQSAVDNSWLKQEVNIEMSKPVTFYISFIKQLIYYYFYLIQKIQKFIVYNVPVVNDVLLMLKLLPDFLPQLP